MPQSKYADALENILLPNLRLIGFSPVKLRDCMRPEVLFKRQHLWLATTWDWRDGILEVSLGDLYWVRDVMARVYVVGRYEDYCPEIKELDVRAPGVEERAAELLRTTIERAIVERDLHPDLAVAECKRFGDLLLGKVSDAQLSQYEA